MSANKKKVQFHDKKTVKKFKPTDSDHTDDDISDGETISAKTKRHTLDSDEEDNSDQIVKLNRECLKDIGQEAKTVEFDDEIKLTPFNMKDELEEGDFDKDGYYHWKKDKDEVKDAWLDNIDWANINSFKKSDRLTKETQEEEEREDDEDTAEEDMEEEEATTKTSDQIEMLKKIIQHLKPGETVLKAIKRLGSSAGGSASSSTVGLSASQRWLKKKNTGQQSESGQNKQDEEKAKADKEALEKLTGLCNHFISSGFYDIYEETLDTLEARVNVSSGSSNAAAFDIFADDVNEADLSSGNNDIPSTSRSNKDILEDSVVKWEYKINNTEEDEVLGPFTSAQMLEKSEKGEFKESGVWCRKVGENTTFYSSKRIDFDLYT